MPYQNLYLKTAFFLRTIFRCDHLCLVIHFERIVTTKRLIVIDRSLFTSNDWRATHALVHIRGNIDWIQPLSRQWIWFELVLTSHQHIKVIRRRGPLFKVSSDWLVERGNRTSDPWVSSAVRYPLHHGTALRIWWWNITSRADWS